METTSLGTQTTYSYVKETDQNKAAKDKTDGKIYYLEAVKADMSPDNNQARNQIIDELMGLVDDQFESYSRALRDTKATKNILVKIASISLSGAAEFSGQTAAKALTAIDMGLKGGSAVVDVEAWNNQAPEMLINTMRAERAKIATEISLSKVKKLADYSLQAAIRDIIRYSNSGHVTWALTALAQQAADSAKISEATTLSIVLRSHIA